MTTVKSQVEPLIQSEGSVINKRIILLVIHENLFRDNVLKLPQFK